jgi:hypothetical protein
MEQVSKRAWGKRGGRARVKRLQNARFEAKEEQSAEAFSTSLIDVLSVSLKFFVFVLFYFF